MLDFDPGERFCTIAHAMIEVETDDEGTTTASIVLSSGGHPLPLLLSADGSISLLGRAGGAIGLFPKPDLIDSFEVLNPGDTLVLYTDGVTEARSPDGAFAPELLEDTLLGCVGLDAASVVRRIEEAVLGFERGKLRDDFALVAIRVPLSGPGLDSSGAAQVDDVFSESYPPVAASVTLARRSLGAWLERIADPPTHEDVLLAVSELASNAVRVARRAVQVRAWREGRTIVVEVADDGPGFSPSAVAGPAPDGTTEQGRGLFLVGALMDDHTIVSSQDGTTVRCRKEMV